MSSKTTAAVVPTCPLCTTDGGRLVWRGRHLRLIRVVDTPEHPAFYRVIWNAHVAEFGDLDPAEAAECMAAVAVVESGLRTLGPDKINLASLGNMVPHLHWHVIARWSGDPHWPQPIWGGAPRRALPSELADTLTRALPALDQTLAAAFAERFEAQ